MTGPYMSFTFESLCKINKIVKILCVRFHTELNRFLMRSNITGFVQETYDIGFRKLFPVTCGANHRQWQFAIKSIDPRFPALTTTTYGHGFKHS